MSGIKHRILKIGGLLPLLVVYLALAIFASSDVLIGDEKRYVQFATNLTNGFYTELEDPNLRNGPGYPVVLAPIAKLGLDWVYGRILNAFFLFLAVYFLYSTLSIYVGKNWALLGAYFLGLYPPALRWMIPLYAEAMALMLFCGFIYYTCLSLVSERFRWKTLLGASFFLGSLVVTKVIFFNVLIGSGLLLLIFELINRKRKLRKLWILFIGSLIVASPFLVYAYQITKKPFYLGTGGGEILYHRATPYEGEWGNWFSMDNVLGLGKDQSEQPEVYMDLSKLQENHGPFYRSVQHLSHIERDSAFKAEAFKNMKAHPKKYAKNSVASLSRFVFNFPSSYRSQNLNAVGYVIPNSILILCFLLALLLLVIRKKLPPFELCSIVLISLVYAGGMVLLSGKGRYFMMLVPGLTLFSIYVLNKHLHIPYFRGKLKGE